MGDTTVRTLQSQNDDTGACSAGRIPRMDDIERVCLGNVKKSLDRQSKTISDDRKVLIFLMRVANEVDRRIVELTKQILEQEGERWQQSSQDRRQ